MRVALEQVEWLLIVVFGFSFCAVAAGIPKSWSLPSAKRSKSPQLGSSRPRRHDLHSTDWRSPLGAPSRQLTCARNDAGQAGSSALACLHRFLGCPFRFDRFEVLIAMYNAGVHLCGMAKWWP